MVGRVVDAKGRTKGVFLTLKEYKQLLHRLEDLEDALELQQARAEGDEFEDLDVVLTRLGIKRS